MDIFSAAGAVGVLALLVLAVIATFAKQVPCAACGDEAVGATRTGVKLCRRCAVRFDTVLYPYDPDPEA